MADTWYLPNGKTEVLFSDEDRIRVIREILGDEAKSWVEELVANKAYEEARANTDCDAYESELDAHAALFDDIKSSVKEAFVQMQADRINRPKIIAILSQTIKLVEKAQ